MESAGASPALQLQPIGDRLSPTFEDATLSPLSSPTCKGQDESYRKSKPTNLTLESPRANGRSTRLDSPRLVVTTPDKGQQELEPLDMDDEETWFVRMLQDLSEATAELDLDGRRGEGNIFQPSAETMRSAEMDLVRFLEDGGEEAVDFEKRINHQLDEALDTFVLDYAKEAESMAEMYRQVTKAEEIISSIANVFTGYGNEFETLSSELAPIKEVTTTVACKSGNRKTACKMLSETIENLKLSPAWIDQLISGEINDAYMEILSVFQGRLSFIYSNKSVRESAVGQELMPRLVDGVEKISNKLYNHIQGKLNQLFQPHINMHIHQLSMVSRYPTCMSFLMYYAEDISHKLRKSYQSSISALYIGKVKSFWKDLSKRINQVGIKGAAVLTKDMPQEGTRRMSFMSDSVFRSPNSPVTPSRKVPIPSLPVQQRADIIKALDTVKDQLILNPLWHLTGPLTFVEAFTKLTVPFMHIIIQESSFVQSFFLTPNPWNISREQFVFNLFESCLSFFEDKLARFIKDSWDHAGLFLLIRVIDAYQAFCTHNRHRLQQKLRANSLHPSVLNGAGSDSGSVSTSQDLCEEDDDAISICSQSSIMSQQSRQSSFSMKSFGFAGTASPAWAKLGLSIRSTASEADVSTTGSDQEATKEKLPWCPPFLLTWLERTQKCLWGRLKGLINFNIKALREQKVDQFNAFQVASIWNREDRPGVLELYGGDEYLKKTTVDHECIKSYCSFVIEMHTINTIEIPAVPDLLYFSNLIINDLALLRNEMMRLLTNLASRHQPILLQTIFMINNLAGILREFDIQNLPPENCDYVAIQEQLEKHVNVFIAEEYPHTPFYRMQKFVDKYETQIQYQVQDVNAEDRTKILASNLALVNEEDLVDMVTSFSETWMDGLEQLFTIANICKYPSAAKLMARAFFTQVLDYNWRMREMVSHCYGENPTMKNLLVASSKIKYVISQKYIQ